MKHPCEPSIEELQWIYRKLMSAPSTNKNMKKIKALELQISRRIKEEEENEIKS